MIRDHEIRWGTHKEGYVAAVDVVLPLSTIPDAVEGRSCGWMKGTCQRVIWS